MIHYNKEELMQNISQSLRIKNSELRKLRVEKMYYLKRLDDRISTFNKENINKELKLIDSRIVCLDKEIERLQELPSKVEEEQSKTQILKRGREL